MMLKSKLGLCISKVRGAPAYRLDLEGVSIMVPEKNVTVCKKRVVGFVQVHNSTGDIRSRFRVTMCEAEILRGKGIEMIGVQ